MENMARLLSEWYTAKAGKTWELEDVANLIVQAQIAAEPMAQAAERERVVRWVEEHRTPIEFEPGVVVYRDHFNSESLIAFIKKENNG
jgi:hypothetical protein